MKTHKSSIKKTLLTGLAVIAPLYLTFLIIRFVFNTLATPLSPIAFMLFQKFNINIPPSPWIISIIAVILTLLLFYFVGLFGTYILAKRLFNKFESILFSIPLVKPVYTTIKEMLSLFTETGEHVYKKVVTVSLFNEKVKIMGFITGSKSFNGEQHLCIFIPTTPIPTTGFLIFAKQSEVKEVNISIEDALKLIISAGIISTEENI